MKWNDIRIIGPLLLAMFAAVTFMSPNFVGASNGVGGAGCVDSVASAEAVGVDLLDDVGDESPCIETPPCEFYNQVAVIITGPDGECCVDANPSIGFAVFPDCEEETTDDDGAEGEEETAAPAAPAVKLPPPPDPIIGPIWLGAIQVDASIPGLVTLTFPDLLAAFIEDNVVTIYDADEVMVFEGRLGADATILVFSDNAPMLVKTQLTTGALYYETVGASTTP